MFNAKKEKDEIVKWIRAWFAKNGPGCNCIVGISGGKDSTVVAALCCEALGKDRVIGVMMPDGKQDDIDVSVRVANYLGIKRYTVNIGHAVNALLGELSFAIEWGSDKKTISTQTLINLPPRIRMATLYAISQSLNGRVSNNCNLSEDWVGYSTRWGDSVGDFAPLANLTVTEVKAIGYELGLPAEFIEKTPSDGLCGKTDEDNLGFTYEVLDRYISTGICDDPEVKARIDYLHEKNQFKMQPIPAYHPVSYEIY
jgi:NAD+ synthase